MSFARGGQRRIARGNVPDQHAGSWTRDPGMCAGGDAYINLPSAVQAAAERHEEHEAGGGRGDGRTRERVWGRNEHVVIRRVPW